MKQTIRGHVVDEADHGMSLERKRLPCFEQSFWPLGLKEGFQFGDIEGDVEETPTKKPRIPSLKEGQEF